MNKLRASFTRNRTTLAIAGAAAVALLAWRNRSTKAPTDPAQASTSAYGAGGQLAGATGGYDSTSADIIGAVQPQIEALRDTVTDLTNLMNGTGGSTPIPVPSTDGIVTIGARRKTTQPLPDYLTRTPAALGSYGLTSIGG